MSTAEMTPITTMTTMISISVNPLDCVSRLFLIFFFFFVSRPAIDIGVLLLATGLAITPQAFNPVIVDPIGAWNRIDVRVAPRILGNVFSEVRPFPAVGFIRLWRRAQD